MGPNGTPEKLGRRGPRAVALLREGNSPCRVAELIGASLGSVHRSKLRAEKGELALAQIRPPGPPMRPSPEHYKELAGLLLLRATVHGQYNEV